MSVQLYIMFDSAKHVEQIESWICKWGVVLWYLVNVTWRKLAEIMTRVAPVSEFWGISQLIFILHFTMTLSTSTMTVLHAWRRNGYRANLKTWKYISFNETTFKQAFAAFNLLQFAIVNHQMEELNFFRHKKTSNYVVAPFLFKTRAVIIS